MRRIIRADRIFSRRRRRRRRNRRQTRHRRRSALSHVIAAVAALVRPTPPSCSCSAIASTAITVDAGASSEYQHDDLRSDTILARRCCVRLILGKFRTDRIARVLRRRLTADSLRRWGFRRRVCCSRFREAALRRLIHASRRRKREREAGVDEDRAAGGREAGDGLAGQSVEFTGVREPQPRSQRAGRRSGSRNLGLHDRAATRDRT